MSTLPAPEFVRIDPAAIEAQLVKRYETLADKTQYPGQIDQLYINQIAYADGLARAAIQAACEKMLVRTSSGVHLDYLGDLVGTMRLVAAPAQTRIAFTCNPPDPSSAPNPAPVTVPAGTLVTSADGRVSFATDETINVGSNPVVVAATCIEPGEAGNGWLPGQINALQSGLPVTASNVTISTGGADVETDDHYRERIMSAPEAYTNAGSYGAYRHHAMSAHQSIVDVAVYGPAEGEPPGQVALYPLSEAGLPSETLIAQVAAAVSDERVRPLTDTVLVRSPEVVDYTIAATLTFYTSADRTDAMARARDALDTWLDECKRLLGVDLVPEQISAVLHVAGVYRVQVTSPKLRVLERHQWGRCTGVTLTDAGAVNG